MDAGETPEYAAKVSDADGTVIASGRTIPIFVRDWFESRQPTTT